MHLQLKQLSGYVYSCKQLEASPSAVQIFLQFNSLKIKDKLSIERQIPLL